MRKKNFRVETDSARKCATAKTADIRESVVMTLIDCCFDHLYYVLRRVSNPFDYDYIEPPIRVSMNSSANSQNRMKTLSFYCTYTYNFTFLVRSRTCSQVTMPSELAPYP